MDSGVGVLDGKGSVRAYSMVATDQLVFCEIV